MTDEITLEILVEEPSAQSVLEMLLPKIVPGVEFAIRDFAGKERLLTELPLRFRGYAARLAWEKLRIVVLIDRDGDDCVQLKNQLERLAVAAALDTLSTAPDRGTVLNRVVIEELEAWYFGDVPALCSAYPRVPASLDKQARFRDPDSVQGGTWEALGRVLKKHGYHKSGFRKLEAARDIAPHMDVESNRSRSFQVFRDGIRRLVNEGSHAEED